MSNNEKVNDFFGQWVKTSSGDGQFIRYNDQERCTVDVCGVWHDMRLETINPHPKYPSKPS